MMKYSELNGLSKQQLSTKLAEQQTALSKLKFAHNVNAIENPSRLGKMRKDIARTLTAMSALKPGDGSVTTTEEI